MTQRKLYLLLGFWLLALVAFSQTAETTSEIVFVDYSNSVSDETSVRIIKPAVINEVTRSTRGFVPIKGVNVEFEGIIEDIDGLREVYLNGNAIIPMSDGSFSTVLKLKSGEQIVTLKVTDGKGNETNKEYKLDIEDAPVVAGLTTDVGDYYALLIGIDQYDDPALVDLSNPISDAKKLGAVLENNYYFKHENIVLLEDASGDEIEETLYQLSQKITDKDNLLIFYAGHGWWDADAEVGYWIPSDARKNSPVKWFRNSTLTDQLRSIKAQHTLLIADACFSGGIFKTRAFFNDASPAVNTLYSMPSRKAMTSGTLTEVPDKSVFLKYLIRRLESNTRKYLPSEQLFSSFKIAVMNNSEITPQYGTIQNVGDEGGDFIFIRKD